ncbi:MAG: aminotransferase class V-fold PLP-dependent enzyme, partial [Anaerovoracaceae bacterium]
KLLTPGPLTTTPRVKEAMLVDHCTWDQDYKEITQRIRQELLSLAHAPAQDYTAILMQGSGTFGVESVISSTVRSKDKILLCTNGEYGNRLVTICRYNQLNTLVYEAAFNTIISAKEVERHLCTDTAITHVAMVHCETTTGILNDLSAIGAVCKKHKKTFIVDAMSSFGGIDLDMPALGIDFLISSANKCIQGVPGFCFILAKKEPLQLCQGNCPT